jgi:hypothetical protein
MFAREPGFILIDRFTNATVAAGLRSGRMVAVKSPTSSISSTTVCRRFSDQRGQRQRRSSFRGPFCMPSRRCSTAPRGSVGEGRRHGSSNAAGPAYCR